MFEHDRRVRQAAREAGEDPAVILLELARILVDIATAVSKVAIALHKEPACRACVEVRYHEVCPEPTLEAVK